MPVDRENAQETIERLHTLPSINSEMSLKKFIESSFDDLERLVAAGNTKKSIYNFLVKDCNLTLGTYASFIYAWSKQIRNKHEEKA